MALPLFRRSCRSGLRGPIRPSDRALSSSAVRGRGFVGGGEFLRLAFIGVLASVAIAASARAQRAAFWPPPYDTVDVVAPRPYAAERVAPVRGFIQVVPLGADAPANADLGDLLDRAAGVSVRRYGGLGSMSLASVRGGSPAQVQIYIDDVPLSTASDAAANLALLPVRLFDRVEVTSGPLAGGSEDAAVGSIRLFSPARFDAPLRLRASAGSFGTTSFSAAGGVGHGAFSILAAGGRLASRGDYPYLDRGGTRLESSDDRIVRRSNNAFHQEDLLLRARAVTGNVQVETMGHGLWKDAGVPGTENLQTHHVRDRFRRWMQSLSIGSRGTDPSQMDGGATPAAESPNTSPADWRLTLHRQGDLDHYRNPDAEVGLGRADTRSHLIADGMRGTLGGESRAATLQGRIDAGLFRERWTLEDLLNETTGATRNRISRSAGTEAACRIGRTTVSAGERILFVEERLDGGAPSSPGAPSGYVPGSRRDRTLPHGRIGVAYDLGRGVAFRSSWGQTLRLPTFTELFGQAGIQIGNPALVPERGAAWDLGVTARWSPTPTVHASVEAAAYETRTRQAIIWIQNSQRTTRPQNLERAIVHGAEFVARGNWILTARSLLGLTAIATFQDARDDGPSPAYHGKRLPYQPSSQASITALYEGASIRIVHTVDAESSIERDRYNTPERRRGARTLQDLAMTWKIPRRSLDATVTVRNLTNRRAQDVDGFPLPGRSVLLDLTWSVR
jgi:iron complex outermembrane receptor protein